MGDPVTPDASTSRLAAGAMGLDTSRARAFALAAWGDIYPGYQSSVILLSEKLIAQRRDAAVRFMKAIMRASRDYVAALENAAFRQDERAARIVGPRSAETGLTEAAIRPRPSTSKRR